VERRDRGRRDRFRTARRGEVKGTVTISPHPSYSYTGADDSDPLECVKLTSVASVIVQQV
jgi:hypothetical protein